MTIKEFLPTNQNYNSKEYTDFEKINDILNDFGFTVLHSEFCSNLKLKILYLKYSNNDDDVYIIRVPTKYEFLKFLHDNLLSVNILKQQDYDNNINENNNYFSNHKYEGCNNYIKTALINNSYIKVEDLITKEVFYIVDYNFIEKYILKSKQGHIFKMGNEELKFLFGIGDK